ncbi:MAG TPA: hypothetical protein VNK49_14570 [Anaerolineales bacterium]|nr:hypothetical protein [Anaerolineales bacterium]
MKTLNLNPIVLSICFLLIASLACGFPGQVSPPAENSPLPTLSALTASTPEPEMTESVITAGRALSDLHVCELVTPEEVASMAGGSVFQEPLQGSSENGAFCTYHVGFPNGDYQQYSIYLEPTHLPELLIECCAADLGKPIEGLGDIAFLEQDENGLFTLLALVKNDFALELTASATGETPISEEMLRGLAATVLERMKR